MAPESTPSPDERRARRQVRKLQAFYIHLTVYLAVIVLLSVINALVTPHLWWVLFPACGWGIGLAIQACVAFEVGIFSPDWTQRQVAKRLRRNAD